MFQSSKTLVVYITVGNAATCMYTAVAGSIQHVTVDNGRTIAIAIINIKKNAIKLLDSVINIISSILPTVVVGMLSSVRQGLRHRSPYM